MHPFVVFNGFNYLRSYCFLLLEVPSRHMDLRKTKKQVTKSINSGTKMLVVIIRKSASELFDNTCRDVQI